jgi:hypothetical protein
VKPITTGPGRHVEWTQAKAAASNGTVTASGSTGKGRSAPADTSKPAAPGVRGGLRDRGSPAQRPRKPAIETRDRRRPLLDDDPQTLQYRSKMVGDLTSTTTNLASGPVQQFQILLDRQR